MSHYIMAARLSNCYFSVVLQIPNHLNNKVTQGDFMALYNKSKEEQFTLLSDVLEGHISFKELKQQKVILCCIFFQNLDWGNVFFHSMMLGCQGLFSSLCRLSFLQPSFPQYLRNNKYGGPSGACQLRFKPNKDRSEREDNFLERQHCRN